MSHQIITEKSFQNPDSPKTAPRVVKFINFSKEDFTYTYNNRPYTFAAGDFRFMETNIANHFAKHLINRELLKEGRESDTSPKNPEENFYFMQLYKKAIEPVETAAEADETEIEQEVIDHETRARLGLKQAKKPISGGSKKAKVAPKVEEDTTNTKKEDDFEIMEADEDEEA